MGGGNPPTDKDAQNPLNLGNWALGVSIIPNNSTSSTLPRAELKAILYDYVGNYISEKYVSLQSSSLNNWLEYSLDWQIPENGILQLLTSNGSDVAVYFDEMSVKLEETMIV